MFVIFSLLVDPHVHNLNKVMSSCIYIYIYIYILKGYGLYFRLGSPSPLPLTFCVRGFICPLIWGSFTEAKQMISILDSDHFQVYEVGHHKFG